MSAIAARRARLNAAQASSSSSSPSPADVLGAARLERGQSSRDKGAESKATLDPSTSPRVLNNVTLTNSRFKRRRAAQEEQNEPHSVDSSCPTSDDEADAGREAARAVAVASMQQSVHTDKVLGPAAIEDTLFAPITRGNNRNVSRIEAVGSQNRGRDADRVQTIVCALKAGERLCLVGVGSIEVLTGSITIGGGTLTSDHREAIVFAPSVVPLPVAQAIGQVRDADLTADEYNFGRPLHAYAAIVRLTSDTESNVGQIPRVYPSMARNPFAASALVTHGWTPTGLAPADPSSRDFLPAAMPQSWTQALQTLSLTATPTHSHNGTPPPICLVRGPKRVGKSTLCRYALQRLLTSGSRPVAYLETDLGQSEFGLPGMVSLHIFDSAMRGTKPSSPLVFGPSWASIRHPVKSHFLSDVSPKGNPSAYLAAIADLFSTYKQRWRPENVPLIVNTQGWVKGMGANLLSQIEDVLQPSIIFDVVEEATPETGANATPLSSSSYRQAAAQQERQVCIIQVEAAPVALTRERGANAVEARTMNLLSYFYSVRLPGLTASGQDSSFSPSAWPRWAFDATLVEQRPYVIDMRAGGLNGGIHVQAHTIAVPERLQLASLNGSCVGLVIQFGVQPEADKTSGGDEESNRIWTDALRKSLPELGSSTCVGLAIVRSVDVSAGRLHLLMPLWSDAFQSAARNLQPSSNTFAEQAVRMSLVKGSLDVPIWLSLDFPTLDAVRAGPLMSSSADPACLAGVALASVPYIDFDLDAIEATVGMAKRRVRRNLLRPSQRPA